MTNTLDYLIDYVSRQTLLTVADLETAIATEGPDIDYSNLLGSELTAVWRGLSAEARLLAILYAEQIRRESLSNDDL